LYYQQETGHPIVDFMEVARAIIQYHHERFDGKGYPQGLKGTEIPLPGRLMAIIDVYDALTSERIYKKALSHTESMVILSDERGKHFDPVVVDAFFNIQDAVKLICSQNQSAT
jgi:putative two-component system response regulator